MKKISLTLLFLAAAMCWGRNSAANAEIMNWCGTYFEENGRGYLRLAREDLESGSNDCSIAEYNERVANTGSASIALDFAKNRSTVSKWRKFNNHLIEVRGKVRNGQISNARLIRDAGV